MNSIIIIILSLLICSCAKVPDIRDEQQNCRIELSFKNPYRSLLEPSATGNSTLQGYGIKDINLYAINDSEVAVRHFYTKLNSDTVITLPSGQWDFYTFANISRDMGELDCDSIENIMLDFPYEKTLPQIDTLPMTGCITAQISRDKIIEIELLPLTAKMLVNVSLSQQLSKWSSITDIQLLSIPEKVMAFQTGHKEQHYVQYRDFPPINEPIFPISFYLPENISVSSSDKAAAKGSLERNESHNPTYLRIGCKIGLRQVYYNIYPGGDASTDFNIRRGDSYIVDIKINGWNPNDYTLIQHCSRRE